MKYHLNTVYHIYNQGNNKRLIFYSRANYFYFLRKIRKHISPIANILAYCLMPNHFHLLVMLKPEAVKASHILKIKTDERLEFQQVFSKQLSIVLRSYTRGLNKEKQQSGSIFRQRTKCKVVHEAGSNSCFTQMNCPTDYLSECFDYIHANPVKAGLVFDREDWPFSSYKDYVSGNTGSFCNIDLGRELGLIGIT